MASSGQQEPHLTISEQSESWWQVLHEPGRTRSLAVATSETAVAVITAARPNFLCIDCIELKARIHHAIPALFDLACQRRLTAGSHQLPTRLHTADRRSRHRGRVSVFSDLIRIFTDVTGDVRTRFRQAVRSSAFRGGPPHQQAGSVPRVVSVCFTGSPLRIVAPYFVKVLVRSKHRR